MKPALHGDPTTGGFRDLTPERLRSVLGHFCSGVVVVTAFDDEPVGFTCQSFASLSLDPPLVSFCPSRTSTTWPRIRDRARFCVNVLSDHHQPLSDGFSRSGADKFAGVSWTSAPSGAPVLEGAGAWVDCTLWNEYDGGDHTIAVGRVEAIGVDRTRRPLVFYRGRYGLGDVEEARA